MAARPTTSHFCDGISRRSAIAAGLAGVFGISMPELLRLQAEGAEAGTAGKGIGRKGTAVIYVLQEGGAPQHETWDPKPLAPVEVRGAFEAINTNVPGVQFCELMAEQAKVADKLTILRGIHHPSTQHSSSVHLMKTGYYCGAASNDNETPSVGSYVSRLRGSNRPGVPPYVSMNGARYGQAMWLGTGHNPFAVDVDPNAKNFAVPNLSLLEGVTSERLGDRKALLAELDNARRIHDTRGMTEGVDQFRAQAFDMVTGAAARKAFDLDAEPVKVRERYGRNEMGQRFLLARRLVEHGVTFVSVGTFGWDFHGDLPKQMQRGAPAFDRGLAALVSDIYERGLAERVLVVAMGEFGREPRMTVINGLPPGREHWGEVMSVLMAGGGLPGGQVVGASDSKGGVPVEGRYRLECVLAHVYRHLGIDPGLTFDDYNGRPRYLLEIRDRISELA
jgi:hypothetical protein